MYQIYSQCKEGPLSRVAKVVLDAGKLLRYASLDVARNKVEEMELRYPAFTFFVVQVDTAHIYDPDSLHERQVRLEERLISLEEGVIQLRVKVADALSLYAERMDEISARKQANTSNREAYRSYKTQPKDVSFRKGRTKR